MSSSMLDRAYERKRKRESSFDFSDEFGMDPVRARYGTSSADVRRAVEQKELDLNIRNQEASILSQQLGSARMAAETNYKLRQQVETDAQLSDAYEQLGNANDLTSLTKISERFPAAQRDEAFRSSYADRRAMLESYETSRLEASKLGALDAFERRVNPPPVALGGSLNATPAEPMDPRRALAEAVDETIATSTEGQLKARGVEVPRLPDGTPDRATMATLRAEMGADRLEPEERQFALDKWRMLARNVSDINYGWSSDQEKQNAIQEMKDLEDLLDPRKRSQRAPGAAPAPSTIPNDDYFTP
jgi:hypothetical protein